MLVDLMKEAVILRHQSFLNTVLFLIIPKITRQNVGTLSKIANGFKVPHVPSSRRLSFRKFYVFHFQIRELDFACREFVEANRTYILPDQLNLIDSVESLNVVIDLTAPPPETAFAPPPPDPPSANLSQVSTIFPHSRDADPYAVTATGWNLEKSTFGEDSEKEMATGSSTSKSVDEYAANDKKKKLDEKENEVGENKLDEKENSSKAALSTSVSTSPMKEKGHSTEDESHDLLDTRASDNSHSSEKEKGKENESESDFGDVKSLTHSASSSDGSFITVEEKSDLQGRSST